MNNVILKAVTGSKAYGLDTPDSDTDIKGIFVAPNQELLGLFWNQHKETIDRTAPDRCYHELGKFIRLASRCNPSVLELLFMADYLKLEATGQLLIDNRSLFLSNEIYKSYGGYALSQARRLNARSEEGKVGFSSQTKNRYAKHARHCYRLLWQGKELLETGNLNVRVTPEQRKKLFALGEMEVDDLVNCFEIEFKLFDKIVSVLPDKPDYKKLNDLLIAIRYAA